MGTNYYVTKESFRMHFGKSSGGWCFLLRIYPDRGIHNLSDWYRYIASEAYEIKDEYGTRVDFEDLMSIVMDRKRPFNRAFSKKDFDCNYAVAGPNNLLRSKIDEFCVGHGTGTWDLMNGEFS
jgi:hypothetical protein